VNTRILEKQNHPMTNARLGKNLTHLQSVLLFKDSRAVIGDPLGQACGRPDILLDRGPEISSPERSTPPADQSGVSERRHSTLFILWVVVSSLGLTDASGNLLANGNFESPGSTLTATFVGVGSGTQITSWTTTKGNGVGANVFYSANGNASLTLPNAESGSYCVQLSSGTGATTGSSIAQSFNVQAGVSYTLSFFINSQANAAGGVSNIRYTLAGAATANQTAATQAAPALPNKNQPWTQVTFGFTATSTGSTTLTFQDQPLLGTNSVSLDNVSVDPATPEFSHWSVIAIFGVACVVLEGRRRRCKVS
jgi:Protein of unknown function (DUF642)